jgi:hypothetical protein
MESIRMLRGPDRRRVRRFFVVHERRSGFDRRRPRSWPGLDGALLYLRANPASVVLLLLLGNLLSLCDLALTRSSLAVGASEANPVMRHLLVADPASATLLKIVLVAGVSLTIWVFRGRRRVLGLALYLPLFYAALVLYEVVCIARLP